MGRRIGKSWERNLNSIKLKKILNLMMIRLSLVFRFNPVRLKHLPSESAAQPPTSIHAICPTNPPHPSNPSISIHLPRIRSQFGMEYKMMKINGRSITEHPQTHSRSRQVSSFSDGERENLFFFFLLLFFSSYSSFLSFIFQITFPLMAL